MNLVTSLVALVQELASQRTAKAKAVASFLRNSTGPKSFLPDREIRLGGLTA
jgi:hypothetical protein